MAFKSFSYVGQDNVVQEWLKFSHTAFFCFSWEKSCFMSCIIFHWCRFSHHISLNNLVLRWSFLDHYHGLKSVFKLYTCNFLLLHLAPSILTKIMTPKKKKDRKFGDHYPMFSFICHAIYMRQYDTTWTLNITSWLKQYLYSDDL